MSSCTSPFVYVVYSAPISTTSTISCSGSITEPGYSLPSAELCLLGWNPPGWYSCSNSNNCDPCVTGWSGWRGWQADWGTCCYCWQAGSTYWYDCTTIDSIPIIPALTISASISSNITLESDTEVIISTTPPTVPIEVMSIVVNSYTANININGTGVTVVLMSAVTLTEANGVFAVEYPLDTFSDSFSETIDGIEFGYDITMSVSILFCLTPVPPQQWVNFMLGFTISISSLDVTDYSTTFTVTVPIV